MRRPLFLLVLGLSILAGVAASAATATTSGGASTAAGGPAVASAAADSPDSLPTEPGLTWLTGCHADKSCGDGTSAHCEGVSSCQVVSNGVRCDGVTTTCPNYCQVQVECSCYCGADAWVSCSSNVGNCQSSGSGVACDGVVHTCFSECRSICGPLGS